MQTCRGLPTVMLFQFQTTWGSDSSPSSSLKRSSAPNFRIAVSSSLLKGFELQTEKRMKNGLELLSQFCHSTKPFWSFSHLKRGASFLLSTHLFPALAWTATVRGTTPIYWEEMGRVWDHWQNTVPRCHHQLPSDQDGLWWEEVKKNR